MAKRHSDSQLGRRLARRRPAPQREFTLALQDRLQELTSQVRRPAHLRSLVLIYLACGVVLLALALAGALGGGPLA